MEWGLAGVGKPNRLIIISNIVGISPRLDCRKALQAKIPGVRLHRQACEI